MKLLYIGDAASIHVQRWTKYFADKGCEVHLASYRSPGEYSPPGVTIHLLTTTRPRTRIVSRVLDTVLGTIKLKTLIRKFSPDIVHAHYVGGYGFLGAFGGFHPYFLTVWGSDVLFTPKTSRLGNVQVKFALTKADIVLTTCQYLKKYVASEFNLPDSKIMSLPWGVDLKMFTKGYKTETVKLRMSLDINDGNFVVLSPRNLSQHYRIEDIIKAMPYVLDKYQNVTLIVLQGTSIDSHFVNQTDRLIKQLGIESNVRLIRRYLSSQEMAVLYNASDAFISIPKTDGFSICIVEGMACGTVPIVANLEVYQQYLNDGQNALFVAPDKPENIASKIIYCIEHPELKQSFYNINSTIITEKEDWAQNAPKLEDLYKSLLNKNKDAQKQTF